MEQSSVAISRFSGTWPYFMHVCYVTFFNLCTWGSCAFIFEKRAVVWFNLWRYIYIENGQVSSKNMKIMTGEQFYSVQNTPTVLLNLRLGLKEWYSDSRKTKLKELYKDYSKRYWRFIFLLKYTGNILYDKLDLQNLCNLQEPFVIFFLLIFWFHLPLDFNFCISPIQANITTPLFPL